MWSFACCSFAVFYRVIMTMPSISMLCVSCVSNRYPVKCYVYRYIFKPLPCYWIAFVLGLVKSFKLCRHSCCLICIHCYGHSPPLLLLYEPFLSIVGTDIFVRHTTVQSTDCTDLTKVRNRPLTYVHMSLHLVFVGRQGYGSRSSTCRVWCV